MDFVFIYLENNAGQEWPRQEWGWYNTRNMTKKETIQRLTGVDCIQYEEDKVSNFSEAHSASTVRFPSVDG